jgi:hypothetical protein
MLSVFFCYKMALFCMKFYLNTVPIDLIELKGFCVSIVINFAIIAAICVSKKLVEKLNDSFLNLILLFH